ncbi:MAG: hypothetical protein ACI8PZ_006480 [Myxococcota bacterium]|jgi:hypothetical protein
MRRIIITATLLSAHAAVAAPGDHIRPSDSTVVTPSLGVGFDYRTNVYRSESAPSSAGSLTITPGLDIGVKSDQVRWRLFGNWVGRKFLFVQANEAIPPAEPGTRVANLDRFNQFAVGTSLDVFSEEPVGIVLDDRATLQNNNADADLAKAPFTTQIRNRLQGGLRVSPGPALDLVLGGHHAFDEFRTPGPEGQQSFNTRNTFGPDLNVEWRFFPRTALVFNLEYSAVRWRDSVVLADSGDSIGTFQGEVALPNSSQVKARTGIEGQFTEKVYFDFLVGYGIATYDEASAETVKIDGAIGEDVRGLDGLLIATEARYQFVEKANLKLGYRKDFLDSFFTNYVAYHYAYAGVGVPVGPVDTSLTYGARFEAYRGDAQRDDIFNRVALDLAINTTDYMSVDLGTWWQQRASSDIAVEYDDWNVHVGATFTY